MYTPPPRRIEALATLLVTPHGRKKARLALLEGVRAAEAVVATGATVTAVLATAEALREPRTAAVAAGFSSRGISVHEMTETFMRAVSQVETPQGLLVICEPLHVTVESALRAPFVLVVDAVQDPGNLGTMLRLAVAFGIGAVVTTKGTVEVANPKTVRAAAGAWPGLSVAEGVETDALVGHLKASGHRIVIADAHGRKDPRVASWTGKVALVAGSEGHGAGAVLSGSAADRIRIPMASGIESLNVGSAVAILLAEAAHQRGF